MCRICSEYLKRQGKGYIILVCSLERTLRCQMKGDDNERKDAEFFKEILYT